MELRNLGLIFTSALSVVLGVENHVLKKDLKEKKKEQKQRNI